MSNLDGQVCCNASEQRHYIERDQDFLLGDGLGPHELNKESGVPYVGAGPTYNWGKQTCKELGELIRGGRRE